MSQKSPFKKSFASHQTRIGKMCSSYKGLIIRVVKQDFTLLQIMEKCKNPKEQHRTIKQRL